MTQRTGVHSVDAGAIRLGLVLYGIICPAGSASFHDQKFHGSISPATLR